MSLNSLALSKPRQDVIRTYCATDYSIQCGNEKYAKQLVEALRNNNILTKTTQANITNPITCTISFCTGPFIDLGLL